MEQKLQNESETDSVNPSTSTAGDTTAAQKIIAVRGPYTGNLTAPCKGAHHSQR